MDQATGKFLERRGDRYVEGEDARLQYGGYAILPSVVLGNVSHKYSPWLTLSESSRLNPIAPERKPQLIYGDRTIAATSYPGDLHRQVVIPELPRT